VDEVVRHLADEDVATVLLGPGIAAIDRYTRRAGEEARGLPALVRARNDALAAEPRAQDPPRLVRADAKEFRVLAGGSNVDGGRGGLDVGIASQVTAVVKNLMNGIAVLTNEGVAPIIHAHPVLTAAAGCLERPAARVEEEALTPQRERLDCLLIG